MTDDLNEETPCFTTSDTPCDDMDIPDEPPNYFLAVQSAVLAYVITSFLTGFFRTQLDVSSPLLLLLLSALPLSVASTLTFLAILLPCARRQGTAKTLQWNPFPRPSRKCLPFPLRLFFLVVTTMAAAMATHYLLYFLGTRPQTQNMVCLFSTTDSPAMLACLTILAVVIAPISEEILFRLGVYQTCSLAMKPRAATILTALVFALAHGQATTLPPLIVVGLFLQQAKKTGGLKLSMLLHAAYNATQIALIVIMKLMQGH